MSYSMRSFGSFSPEPLKGCGTTPADVRVAQNGLNLLGYTDAKGQKLTPDGKFGPSTAQALAKFATAALAKGRPDTCRALMEATVSGSIPGRAAPKAQPQAVDHPALAALWAEAIRLYPNDPSQQAAYALTHGPGFGRTIEQWLASPDSAPYRQAASVVTMATDVITASAPPAIKPAIAPVVVGQPVPEVLPAEKPRMAKTEAAPAPEGQVAKATDKVVESKATGLSRNAMLAIGGAALGVAFLASMMRPRAATPNRATRNYPVGEILTVGKGSKAHKVGHHTPPKKYRKLGATSPSDYAWPEGYMYPIHDAKHVRVALGRFGRFKKSYPKAMRQTIARRLNQAKKKFGIAGKTVTA